MSAEFLEDTNITTLGIMTKRSHQKANQRSTTKWVNKVTRDMSLLSSMSAEVVRRHWSSGLPPACVRVVFEEWRRPNSIINGVSIAHSDQIESLLCGETDEVRIDGATSNERSLLHEVCKTLRLRHISATDERSISLYRQGGNGNGFRAYGYRSAQEMISGEPTMAARLELLTKELHNTQ